MSDNMRDIEKRARYGGVLNAYERTLRGMATQISEIQTKIGSMKVDIDADDDFTAEDKTLINQANNLINNAKCTDFVTHIQGALG